MKQGATVRLKQPVIQGEVAARRIVNDEIELLVRWTDADNTTHERWFPEQDLELVPVKEGSA